MTIFGINKGPLGCSLLVLAACLFAGCGGRAGSIAEPEQPLADFTPTAIGYVPNTISNTVTSFLLDEQTGMLSQGSTAQTGVMPLDAVVTPNRRFLFVSNAQDKTISRFVLDGQGGMQAVGTAVHLSTPGGQPWSLQVTPSGKFLFVGTKNAIEVFSIDAATGDLTPILGSPFVVGSGEIGYTMTHSGELLFAMDSIPDELYPFSVDGSSGRIDPLSIGHIDTELALGSTTINPSDSYLFAVAPSAGKVVSYSLQASGALRLTGTANLPNNAFVTNAVFTPDGRFVYMADASSNNSILAYSVDQLTGFLTPVPGSPFIDGQSPSSLAISPNSSILVVTRINPGHIASYRIDRQTGTLSPISGSGFDSGLLCGRSPSRVVLVPK